MSLGQINHLDIAFRLASDLVPEEDLLGIPAHVQPNTTLN
jgi:hypothetical protein